MTSLSQIEIFNILRDATWTRAPENSEGFVFNADATEFQFALRMNDFPAEDLFTVFLNGTALFNFNDWPKALGAAPWKGLALGQ